MAARTRGLGVDPAVSKPPVWWTVSCHRCGEATQPDHRVQDLNWGLLCGRCKPEDYEFDAGFDRRMYNTVMDLTPVNPCPRCRIGLPVIGICDCS